jgi:hypothetical protein
MVSDNEKRVNNHDGRVRVTNVIVDNKAPGKKVKIEMKKRPTP